MTANPSMDNYFLADPRQAYLLNTTARKLFPHLKKCRKLSLKPSIVIQIFNCIHNKTGTLGDPAFMMGVPAITLGVPPIMLGVPAITAGVPPSRTQLHINIPAFSYLAYTHHQKMKPPNSPLSPLMPSIQHLHKKSYPPQPSISVTLISNFICYR